MSDVREPYPVALSGQERAMLEEFAAQRNLKPSRAFRVALKTIILLDNDPTLSYNVALQKVLMLDTENRGRKKKCS